MRKQKYFLLLLFSFFYCSNVSAEDQSFSQGYKAAEALFKKEEKNINVVDAKRVVVNYYTDSVVVFNTSVENPIVSMTPDVLGYFEGGYPKSLVDNPLGSYCFLIGRKRTAEEIGLTIRTKKGSLVFGVKSDLKFKSASDDTFYSEEAVAQGLLNLIRSKSLEKKAFAEQNLGKLRAFQIYLKDIPLET